MTNKIAVFYQETGEEGILHFEPGETLEQLLERAPEEWRYRRTETPRDYATWSDEDWERDERLRDRYGDDYLD